MIEYQDGTSTDNLLDPPSTYTEDGESQNRQQSKCTDFAKWVYDLCCNAITETTSVNQNIISFFWVAFVFFIGLIVVVAQYTDDLPSFTFCKTYEMLTAFITLGIIGMSCAIGFRNNPRVCYHTAAGEDDNEHHDDDHDNGIQSKYLIGNAYVFAAGNISLDMFSIASVFHCGLNVNNTKNCYVAISIFHSFRVVFTSLQLIFLQVFTSIKVKKRYLFPFKILVSHVIATNALIWFTFLCLETGILNGDSDGNDSEYTLNCTNTPNDDVYKTAQHADEKLQPFILEFSLLAASLLYAICPIKSNTQVSPPTSRKTYYYKSIETVTKDDSKAYKSDPGLLIGILAALILILSSWSLDDVNHYIEDLRFNYSVQILTHITIIGIASWAYYELRKFHKKKAQNKRKYQTDDYLLLFTGTCSALPFMFTIFFSVCHHIDNTSPDFPKDLVSHESEIRTWMGLVCVFTVTSVLFQTLFLLEAHSYDRALVPDNNDASEYGKLRSAARIGQLFLLLLVLNFGFWVTNSFFELHNDLARTYPIARLYWKQKTWGFITKLLYPILIFFRFHSVAVIAHIWLDFRVKKKTN